MPQSTTTARTRELLASITRDDDGAHVIDLIRLLKFSGAIESEIGEEAMKELYSKTEDFNEHFHAFVKRL